MKTELEKTQKEAVMAYFKVLSCHISGGGQPSVTEVQTQGITIHETRFYPIRAVRRKTEVSHSRMEICFRLLFLFRGFVSLELSQKIRIWMETCGRQQHAFALRIHFSFSIIHDPSKQLVYLKHPPQISAKVPTKVSSLLSLTNNRT